MTEHPLDTAHEQWDDYWREDARRSQWSTPEPDVAALLPALRASGVRRVLDLGAGIGRHAVLFAREGFDVVAVDASTAGADSIRQAAAAEGVSVDVRVARFTEVPLDDGEVDHVLAWNVLYHGDRGIALQGLSECRRVLRQGGLFQFTMLSKRNRGFGVGREVSLDTYVDDDSDYDKRHPHFYCDAAGAAGLLHESGFEVSSLVDVDQAPPGAYHWHIVAEAVTGTPLLR